MDDRDLSERLDELIKEVDEVQSLINRARRISNLPEHIRAEIDLKQDRVDYNRFMIRMLKKRHQSVSGISDQ